MIDRDARNQLAEQLRHLVDGLITNDEFEFRVPRSADPAVHEIYLEAWGTYDDLHEHKLKGKYELTPEAKEFMARCVLFLKTDQPWPWPSRKFVFSSALSALILVVLGFRINAFVGLAVIPSYLLFWFAYRRWYRSLGDQSIWPFGSREAFEGALANPPYLSGRAV